MGGVGLWSRGRAACIGLAGLGDGTGQGRDEALAPASRFCISLTPTERATAPSKSDARALLRSSDTAADAAMDRYAGGDEAAFSKLYDLLAPRLFAFLLRRATAPPWRLARVLLS